MLRKIFAPFVLVLFLGACAIFKAETLDQKAFALGADFNAVLVAAAAYENLPRCPEGIGSDEQACSETKAVAKIRASAIVAKATVEAMENTIIEGKADDSTKQRLIDGARNAVVALQVIIPTVLPKE